MRVSLIVLMAMALCLGSIPVNASDLLNFNEPGATGTTWPGWTWVDAAAQNPKLPLGSKGADGFGNPGWINNSGALYYGNWYPRTVVKSDMGNKDIAIIDPATRAPDTSDGAGMNIYNAALGVKTTASATSGSNIVTVADSTGWVVGDNFIMAGVPVYNALSKIWSPQISAINGNQFTVVRSDNKAVLNADATASNTSIYPRYASEWWFNYGDNFGTMGLADATTNRMSMYIKTTGMPHTVFDAKNIVSGNFHVGTYLCWPGGAADGGNCPKEAQGTASTLGAAGQHYYHYLTINSGAWLHVLLDQSPTHQRQSSGIYAPPNDPQAPDHHYFQSMNQFYTQIIEFQPGPTSLWIDEIKLYTTEQAENDVSVCTPWVGFWPMSGNWEIGFQDNSWSGVAGTGSPSESTYEIRYSTSPITNSNWDLATPITPAYNAQTNANAGSGRIRRPNTWKLTAWTRFSLPLSVMQSTNKMYFAIKDVSALANGDNHDSPSSLVKTIDYYHGATDTSIPGSCGPSNGLALSSAPVSGLCTAGAPSAVSGTGPWSWTCAGSGGGSTASCGATLLDVPPVGDASALVACPAIAGFR